MQDTLERALTKFHLWKRGTDLRAWLFTIMHNVYVNQVRGRREFAVLDDEMLELPARATQEVGLEARDLEPTSNSPSRAIRRGPRPMSRISCASKPPGSPRR